MTYATLAVFALTYALIGGRRLRALPIGRPAGALLGAVAMVAIGALTPEQSYAAIDHDTLALLLGMMLLAAYIDRAGLFARLTHALLRAFRSPRGLLAAIAVGGALLSAFLVNDTVCLFATPLVVALCERGRLPYAPFLLALATSANIGSAATLVGNPQNMIIGGMSGLGFSAFLLAALPAVLLALAVNLALLFIYFGRRLPAALDPIALDPPTGDGRAASTALVTLLVIAGFFAGLHPGYLVLGGAALLILRDRQDPQPILARVDGALLLFFAALFVVVAGLRGTGLIDDAWTWSRGHIDLTTPVGLAAFTGAVVLGSNLISNVPFVLMVGDRMGDLGAGPFPWVLLAFTSTLAGNLTLLGSVANIIVAEGARHRHDLGFVEYLRFGAVSTLLTLVVGVAALAFAR